MNAFTSDSVSNVFDQGCKITLPWADKSWAHQKQLENGRTIQHHPLATDLLLLPDSRWSSIFEYD